MFTISIIKNCVTVTLPVVIVTARSTVLLVVVEGTVGVVVQAVVLDERFTTLRENAPN